MFRCFRIEHKIKAVTLAVLLASTGALQAGPDSADGVTAPVAAAPQTSSVQAGETGLARWSPPSHKAREMIPPPPPGPYMSSALSGFSMQRSSMKRQSIKLPSFGGDPEKYEPNQPAFSFSSDDMPMDMFSPDRPWPEDLRAGNNNAQDRWLPEGGYRYFKQAAPAGGHAVPGRVMPVMGAGNPAPMNNAIGRAYGPNVNRPASRWMPSMNSAPVGSGFSMPGFNAPGFNTPGYNQYLGSRYPSSQYPGLQYSRQNNPVMHQGNAQPRYYGQQNHGYDSNLQRNNYGGPAYPVPGHN